MDMDIYTTVLTPPVTALPCRAVSFASYCDITPCCLSCSYINNCHSFTVSFKLSSRVIHSFSPLYFSLLTLSSQFFFPFTFSL
jgi:hypothetical protein